MDVGMINITCTVIIFSIKEIETSNNPAKLKESLS